MNTKTRIRKRRPTAEEIAAIMAFYGGAETADLPFPHSTHKSPAEGKKITIQTTVIFE